MCRTADVLLTHGHYGHIMGLLSGSVFPPEGMVRFYGQFRRWCGMGTLAYTVVYDLFTKS